MPVTVAKTVTIAGALPILATAQVSLGSATALAQGAVSLVLPGLQARLSGLVTLQARLAVTPPSVAASLDVLAKLTASLNAALSASPPVVSGAAQVAAVATAVAELQGSISALVSALAELAPALELSAEIAALLVGGSFVFYAYEGTLGDLGPGLDAAIAEGKTGGLLEGDPVRAVTLVAGQADPTASASLKTLFAI
jgi:hypothetical protein